MYSKHYVSERIEREKLIQKIGIGIELDTIRVDRHHINGAELHTITSTGIIIIRNERTKKIVTKLIVEPVQSQYSDTGSIEIQRAKSNPSGQSYILNLSYYIIYA